MSAIFQPCWVRKLIGKLGVPYNRGLRVRGSPQPHDYVAVLPPRAAESKAFRIQVAVPRKLCLPVHPSRGGSGSLQFRFQNILPRLSGWE